jgi:hypothetical protein
MNKICVCVCVCVCVCIKPEPKKIYKKCNSFFVCRHYYYYLLRIKYIHVPTRIHM